jgi:hypothetical protein
MQVSRCRQAVVVAALCALAGVATYADVKKEERTQFKFEGMLGRMVGLFGGKGAREGIVNTVAVKGDRRLTRTDNTAQIVDLAEEKVYDLDLRKKTYRVVTFEALRRQIREAEEKARREAEKVSREEEKKAAEPRDPNDPQMEIDFDMKESGQRKTIAGHDTREVVMTIAVREKGKTLEQGGGMVLVSNTWLAPEIEALKSDLEFERRYAQKIYGEALSVEAMQQMAAAMAMYPGLKDAMERMSQESVNMSGTPLLTTMTFQAVKSEQQVAEEKQQQPQGDSNVSASPGGVGGMLARRMMRKKQEAPEAAADGNRATIMTSTVEVLKISPEVSDADVALPAGFKEVR